MISLAMTLACRLLRWGLYGCGFVFGWGLMIALMR